MNKSEIEAKIKELTEIPQYYLLSRTESEHETFTEYCLKCLMTGHDNSAAQYADMLIRFIVHANQSDKISVEKYYRQVSLLTRDKKKIRFDLVIQSLVDNKTHWINLEHKYGSDSYAEQMTSYYEAIENWSEYLKKPGIIHNYVYHPRYYNYTIKYYPNVIDYKVIFNLLSNIKQFNNPFVEEYFKLIKSYKLLDEYIQQTNLNEYYSSSENNSLREDIKRFGIIPEEEISLRVDFNTLQKLLSVCDFLEKYKWKPILELYKGKNSWPSLEIAYLKDKNEMKHSFFYKIVNDTLIFMYHSEKASDKSEFSNNVVNAVEEKGCVSCIGKNGLYKERQIFKIDLKENNIDCFCTRFKEINRLVASEIMQLQNELELDLVSP